MWFIPRIVFCIPLAIALAMAAGCSSDEQTDKKNTGLTLFQQAKIQSQEIINSIGDEEAFLSHFRDNPFFPDLAPPKHVHEKLMECGVNPARLQYFDYFKEILLDTTELDIIDYFYQGPCACPDIRIMITFYLYKKQDKIQLTRFRAEPVAKPSDWIDNINKRNAEAARK